MAVLEDIKRIAANQLSKLSDIRNVAMYLFVLIVLAIAWSSARTIQNNYTLQKQISSLKQQNEILKLTNQNTELETSYLRTDQYLELAARQNLGLSAPGEKVLTIPKSVALKYVDPTLSQQIVRESSASIDNRSKYLKNLETWRDFLLGRKIVTD